VSHRAALIALVIAACGKSAPSKAEIEKKKLGEERARAAEACNKGDGASCFVAVVGLDPLDKNQLAIMMHAWERGCSLGHAASCGQLGTVAEFDMNGGGANPDKMEAARWYMKACELGDAQSCKSAGMPLPKGVADPDAPPPFPWREALTPICGKGHAELGPIFSGLVPGQPMPDAMNKAVAEFEKKFKAHVHYYAGDSAQQSSWEIYVRFDEKAGMYPVLVGGWGKPDLPFGAWQSPTGHVTAWYMSDGQTSGISWGPYHSIDEIIRPDDKELLGFEPIRLVGTKVSAIAPVLGDRWRPIGPDEYQVASFTTIDSPFDLRAIETRGVITELHTFNWITNSSDVGDQIFAALEAKWGKPAIGKDGVHTWKLPGRLVKASKPASGNFDITITKR